MDTLERLAFYAPIKRVDDEARMVYGVATSETPVEDIPGLQIVLTFEATVKAAEQWAQWGNIREMHRASAVGVAQEITPRADSRDLYVGAYIVDEEAWRKVKAGVYKGYSIRAAPVQWEEEAQTNVVRVTDYKIIELSLVDRPHDPEAKITVWRGLDIDRDLEQQELEAAASGEETAAETAAPGEETPSASQWAAGGDMYLWITDRNVEWDPEAAYARLLEHATEGAVINWAEYGRAFFLRDIANPEHVESYRLQFAAVDAYGDLVAVPAAIFAVAQELEGLGLPDALRLSVERRVMSYYHNMGRLAPWEILRKLKRQRGEDMNALDKMWVAVMGEEVELPDSPEDVERILRSRFAPVEEAAPGDGGADETPETGPESELVTLLRGLVSEMADKIQALDVRLARIESQPAALPVEVTGPGEPTLEEQIGELERLISDKQLPPNSQEVQRLLRLYHRSRQQ